MVECAEREIDRGIDVEVGPGGPSLVEVVSERASHGDQCVAQRLSLTELEFEAVHPAQRLVRRAQTRGNVRIATRKHQVSGDRERPREGQCVANRVAELQALAEVAGRELEVTVALREHCKVCKACGRPINVAKRTMTFEGFHYQRRRTLVVALGEQDVGKVPLCDRRATEVPARLREPEGFDDEIRSHVAEKIGKLARPKRIIYADDLPKTRSGKIMRRLLKDIAEGHDLGDTTTLRDPAVVDDLKRRADEILATSR